MKKIKPLIPLLVLTFLFFGFKGSAQVEPITFTGVMSNPPDSKFSILKIGSGIPAQQVEITADGTFNMTLTSGTGRYLFHDGRGRIDLYLVEGDDVKLSIDGKRVYSSAKVTGKYPEASQYLIAKPRRQRALRGSNEKFYPLPEAEYKQVAKLLKDDLYGFMDSLKNIPEAFLKEERKELHYNYLVNLVNYERMHQRFADKPEFKTSPDFLDEIEGIDFSNEADYRTVSAYKKLVPAYYQASVDKLTKEGMFYGLAEIKVYSTIPNEYIKNDLINSTASSMSSAPDKEEFYNAFIAASTSTRNNNNLNLKYEELKKVATGKPSPVFTDYVNHAGGKTSLSDLKGKYIYIDVWATWCVPCLAELPSLKKVEKQYHGKNIQFLSISVDTDNAYATWVKMVKDKEMVGMQLFADKSFKSDFIAAYGVSGIPRFILIDPSGNIVSANAPRPSDHEKLVSLFNLLKI